MREKWKDIKDYDGLYQVSNLGNVKSLGNKSNHKEPIILKPTINKNGYMAVRLQKDKKVKYIFIHKLVAEAFLRKKKENLQVNHKDGNKRNNKVNNLEWCTASENIIHSFKIGLRKPTIKKVYQLDKNNNLINIYKSAKEASKKTGVYYTDITQCCRNEIKSAGGYIWKYESAGKGNL